MTKIFMVEMKIQVAVAADALHLQQMKKSPDARRLGILPSPCHQGC